MLIMGSANEAELIFWNKEDQRRVPVQGDPRRQGCYVLHITLDPELPFLYFIISCYVVRNAGWAHLSLIFMNLQLNEWMNQSSVSRTTHPPIKTLNRRELSIRKNVFPKSHA